MSNNGAFIKLDKTLFTAPYVDMPIEDKIVYSILHDRYMLSLNNEFRDDEGNICVIYPDTDMSNMLGCTRQKIGRIMKRLVDRGLIKRRMQEKGMPYYIYVLPLSSGATSPSYDTQQEGVTRDNTNNTDVIKTESRGIDHIRCDIDSICCHIAEQWDYRYICTLDDDIANTAGKIIDVATAIMCITDDRIYIAGTTRDTTHVQSVMMKLTSLHIIDIARRIIGNQEEINDMYGYIAASLYNSGIQVPG